MEPSIESRSAELFDNSKEPYYSAVFTSVDQIRSEDIRNHNLIAQSETIRATDILDKIAPDWCFAIKDIRVFDDIVTVIVSVTIDGITREGLGSSNAKNGKGFKSAEESALKEAASKFKSKNTFKTFSRRSHQATNDSFQGGANYVFNPVAQSLSDQITSKQLCLIRDFGRESGLDTIDECSRMMRCHITELSRLAASLFIDHLQGNHRKPQMPELQLARFTA